VLPVLAHVTRSGFVESRHHGSLALLDADGSVAYAAGDVTSPIYPRSSLKPMQAAAVLRAGAPVEGRLLALAAGSHAGEPFHVAGVRQLLSAAELPVDALRCPPSQPLDTAVWEKMLADGDDTDRRLLMNCSGKHAAFLLACVTAGWPTKNYLDAAHPLQRLVADEISSAAGEPIAHTGVDGCGAPTATLSLTGLATAYRAFALASLDTVRGQVAGAMREHPQYVSGTRQPDTALMAHVPGALAKGGAEGVLALALPDGRAVALKIDDGAKRAAWPVAVAALRRLGVEAPVLNRLAEAPTFGRGEPVGAVEALPLS
jgi:L-asparaginase II